VNPDSLAVEVIAKAMDGGRNFLAQRHTVKYMRSGEVMQARLAGREGWTEWETSGHQGIVDRAAARATELLASHEVPPLSQPQQAEMEKVIRTVEREIGQ
jgi:trimethylamine:corrinoid methyltransferase-like protein